MKRALPSLLSIASIIFALTASNAFAQGSDDTPKVATPETQGNPPPEEPDATPSIQSSLGKYGDPGGIRAALEKKGIKYQFTYIGEVLGNTSGGVKRGATYEGALYGQVDVEFDKLIGAKDFAGHISAYNIHGRGLSGNNLQNYFVISSIEAYPDTLLYEAWVEGQLADKKIAVRAGNLAVDQEFFISQTATLFVNSTFGWPTNYGTNLPSGGNAFPFGAPGVRVKYTPNDNLNFLAAIYDGDPAGPFIPGYNSPITQLRYEGGLAFRTQDPPFLITEAQYSYAKGTDREGVIKLGYFHHFENFESNDIPGVNYRGNNSVYGMIDQTIYREKGTKDQGAAVFGRISYMPGDRNFFDIYADAGISYKGLIPGRDDDTVGVGAGYGRVSPSIKRNDILGGNAPFIEDYEALIEATYQYTVVPGFTVQPDFQYVFHPGARGVADQSNGLPARDAAVFGLRSTVVY